MKTRPTPRARRRALIAGTLLAAAALSLVDTAASAAEGDAAPATPGPNEATASNEIGSGGAAEAADSTPSAPAPTGSRLAEALQPETLGPDKVEPHALRRVSMFAVSPPKAREFQPHDLVQILVRETSRVNNEQRLDTKKDFELDGRVARWPDLQLADLFQLQAEAGRTTNLPELDVAFGRGFKGDGEYERREDFTARLTAEVIEVLPNGNLVLESRTFIKTDREETELKVTGICRQEDVTAANTVLSNQLHDLRIEKVHQGELPRTNEKGVIAKVLEAIFAF